MEFFDEMKRGANQVAGKTAQKAQELSGTGRLTALIREEEARIREAQLAIGVRYAELHAEDYEADFAQMMETICEAKKRIEGYQDQIRSLKGGRTCPACGRTVTAQARFCNYCGTKLPPPESSGLICAGCGRKLEPDMRFCTYCGKPVGSADAGRTEG